MRRRRWGLVTFLRITSTLLIQVLPEKRKKQHIDYSVFLDEKEFAANDDKFEEHIAKINEWVCPLDGTSCYFTSHLVSCVELSVQVHCYSEGVPGYFGLWEGAVQTQVGLCVCLGFLFQPPLPRGNEKNFSVKSRMMDMRKAVNHPYLIEYPVSDCGTFYNRWRLLPLVFYSSFLLFLLLLLLVLLLLLLIFLLVLVLLLLLFILFQFWRHDRHLRQAGRPPPDADQT